VPLESAVKHNAVEAESRLEIRLCVAADRVEVKSRRRAGLEVRDDGETFTVVLPLQRVA
jgi:hypothetical protein